MSEAGGDLDWDAWCREAVALMSERTHALLDKHLSSRSPYSWDLETATFQIGDTAMRLVAVGTVDGGSFLWCWADEEIPQVAREGLERVRQFGADHDLELLVEEGGPGGLPRGKECLAAAGRILDANAVWIEPTGDGGFILFALFERM